MTFTAHVQNGSIPLPPELHFPNGLEVHVTLAVQPESTEDSPLYEAMKEFFGKAEGLPSDFSAEHNHYLHGTPRRTPK